MDLWPVVSRVARVWTAGTRALGASAGFVLHVHARRGPGGSVCRAQGEVVLFVPQGVWTQHQIAVLMALHPRVGARSAIGGLGEDVLRHILELCVA
jgi:hypothetical protein